MYIASVPAQARSGMTDAIDGPQVRLISIGETQQNLMQIFSVGALARASEGPHHQNLKLIYWAVRTPV